METIYWIGFSQSIFAAFLTGSKKENSAADKILTAWLSLLGIEFFTCALDYRIFGDPLLSSSFLLINPAFYLYVKSLILKDFRLKYIQMLHLAPFIVFETIAYWLNKPFSLENFFVSGISRWYDYLFSAATLISWFHYNSASSLLIYRHRNKLMDEFSTIESNKKITWLYFIVIFYNLYCFAIVITSILTFFLKLDFLLPHIVNYSALLLLVFILAYQGLHQKTISLYTEMEVRAKETVRSLQIPENRRKMIRQELEKYFLQSKPYLNPDLSMTMLAEHLKIPKHQLTDVLNADMGVNFFHYVNNFRIEAVKKMLSDPRNRYSAEAVGYECGFNSKSSFFTVFKKLTGKTPMEYKNSEDARKG
jgi:AraC-like DNA-binding protein